MKRNVILGLFAITALLGGLLLAVTIQDSGEQRPGFALPDTTGTIRNVSEWDGKLLLLNFWATWCAPCRKEIPILIEAQRKYGGAGLQVVGLAVDEREPVRKYAEDFGINYPLLVDAMNVVKVQDAYNGGAGLPVSILVDRDGIVRERVIGEMHEAQLDALLAPYMAQ